MLVCKAIIKVMIVSMILTASSGFHIISYFLLVIITNHLFISTYLILLSMVDEYVKESRF
jgi:hypothetical protein